MRAAALDHWRFQCSHTALAAWVHHVQHSKHLNALAGKAVSFLQNSKLGSAFRAWEDHVQHRMEGRRKAAAALKHWQQGAVSAAFTAWAAVGASACTAAGTASAAVVARWRESMVSASFTVLGSLGTCSCPEETSGHLCIDKAQADKTLSMAFCSLAPKCCTEAADERQVRRLHSNVLGRVA